MEAAPHSNFSQMLPRHETFSEKSVLSRSELWHLPGFLVPAAYPVLTSFSKKSQGAAPCLPLCLVLDDQEGLSGSVQMPDLDSLLVTRGTQTPHCGILGGSEDPDNEDQGRSCGS